MRPTFLHPDTLDEAVQMLAEYGQRACLVGGSESPPPSIRHSGIFIDTSHLADLAGIHQLGGRVIIGANTPHSIIARSSLIRLHGACFAEASEETNHPSASVLTYDLRPATSFPVTILALSALSAEIESARLDSEGGTKREWSPIEDVWNPSIVWTSRLALAVRFSVGGQTSGSALIAVNPPPGTDAAIQATAAYLSLKPDQKTITNVKVVLAPRQGVPFTSPSAVAQLLGNAPDPARIEQAAQAALSDARVHFSPSPPTTAYPIDLAAHLTRQALDKSLARALNKSPVARL